MSVMLSVQVLISEVTRPQPIKISQCFVIFSFELPISIESSLRDISRRDKRLSIFLLVELENALNIELKIRSTVFCHEYHLSLLIHYMLWK